MSEYNKINVSVLRNKQSNFHNELEYFIGTSSHIFSSSYLSGCSEPVVRRMNAVLGSKYDKIRELYQSIDRYFESYLHDVEGIENALIGNSSSGSINESGIRSAINKLPELKTYNPNFQNFANQNFTYFNLNTDKKNYSSELKNLSSDTKKRISSRIQLLDVRNATRTTVTNDVTLGYIISKLEKSFKNKFEEYKDLISGVVGNINEVIEVPELSIEDEIYNDVLTEYISQFDNKIAVDETDKAIVEKELARFDQVEALLILSKNNPSYVDMPADVQFTMIEQAKKEALSLLNGEFSSIDEYKTYIKELKTLISLYDADINDLNNSKEMAKYDCLEVMEDFQNYNYEIKKLDNFKTSKNTRGEVSFISYDNYCKEYGEVSILSYAKTLNEVVGEKWIETNGTEEMKNLQKFLTAAEVDSNLGKTYNYLFEKYGSDYANEYLRNTEGKVNNIIGMLNAEAFLNILSTSKSITSAITNHLQVGGKGVLDGVVSFGAGVTHASSAISAFFSDDKPSRFYTAEEYENMYIMQALQNGDYTGSFLSNNYEISQGIGNMLPSIALSYFNPTLGSVALGVSSGGNSYHSALVEGKSNLQALTYGIISGSSEAITERLLGGIPGLSDVKAVDLKTFVQSILKEGTEEGIQEVCDAFVRSGVLGEGIDSVELAESVIKSVIYGGITAGILQTPSAILNSKNIKVINTALEEGVLTNYEIIDILNEHRIDTDGKTITDLINENPEILSKIAKEKFGATSANTEQRINSFLENVENNDVVKEIIREAVDGTEEISNGQFSQFSNGILNSVTSEFDSLLNEKIPLEAMNETIIDKVINDNVTMDLENFTQELKVVEPLETTAPLKSSSEMRQDLLNKIINLKTNEDLKKYANSLSYNELKIMASQIDGSTISLLSNLDNTNYNNFVSNLVTENATFELNNVLSTIDSQKLASLLIDNNISQITKNSILQKFNFDTFKWTLNSGYLGIENVINVQTDLSESSKIIPAELIIEAIKDPENTNVLENFRPEEYGTALKYLYDQLQATGYDYIFNSEEHQMINNIIKEYAWSERVIALNNWADTSMIENFKREFSDYVTEEQLRNLKGTYKFIENDELPVEIPLGGWMGFNDGTTNYLNLSFDDSMLIATISHESIHQLATTNGYGVIKNVYDSQGNISIIRYNGVNEAITEYLTKIAMGSDYPPDSYSGYAAAVNRLEVILNMNLEGVNIETIKQAYFGNDINILRSAIDNVTTQGFFDTYLETAFDEAINGDTTKLDKALTKIKFYNFFNRRSK